MTQEDLISIRGLTDGFEDTPLREFLGTLDGYPSLQRNNRTIVSMNFTDVEIIESTSPYPFPVASIEFALSNRKKSAWGIWSESVNELIPEDADMPYLVGKRLHLKRTPGHMLWSQRDGKEVERNCWELQAILGEGEGVATGLNAAEIALEMLKGKTEQEFNQAIFQSQEFRASTDSATVQQNIISKTFIPAVLASGVVVKDADGRFQRAD